MWKLFIPNSSLPKRSSCFTFVVDKAARLQVAGYTFSFSAGIQSERIIKGRAHMRAGGMTPYHFSSARTSVLLSFLPQIYLLCFIATENDQKKAKAALLVKV